MKNTFKMTTLSLLMIWLSTASFGFVSMAQKASTPPPEGLDFSVLSEANPVKEFSIAKGEYKAALAGNWKVVGNHVTVKWNTSYGDDAFQLIIFPYTLSGKSYNSYLVSPALDLAGVSGMKLSMMLAASIPKGESPFRIYIIDKGGNMLHTLYDAKPDAKGLNELYAFDVSLPTGMTGTGFIAFIGAGDRDNRVSLKMQDLKLATASTEVSISAQPVGGLSYDVVNVGEVSVRKEVSVFIKNFTGTPVATLVGAGAKDFTFDVNNKPLAASGGKLGVYFTPQSAGTRNAAIEVTAGDKKMEIPLVGEAKGENPEPAESVELLEDQFFYEFDGDKPTKWTTDGLATKLESKMGYNASTGFAVQIDTREIGKEKVGLLKQEVDLNRQGKEVKAGDVLEGMIHYRSEEPKNEAGAVRFACHWLDKKGAVIAISEDAFLANKTLWFDRHKVWDEIKFRVVAPAGAVRFVFVVEVNAQSVVRLDDFSLLRLIKKDRERPFMSLYPHFATISAKVGEPSQGRLIVQGAALGAAITAEIKGPEGELVLSDAVLPAGNNVKEMIYTLTPRKKGVYLIGKPGSYAVRFGNGAEIVTHALTVNVIDASNPPAVVLSSPATLKPMEALAGETIDQELIFDVKGVIGSVDLKLEQPAGGAFRMNSSQFYYSATQDKVLNNKIKLSFAPKTVGEYSATLVLSSPMMEPVRLELKGKCIPTGEGWTEAFKQDRPKDPRFVGEVWNGYHLFDRGYYRLDGKWLSEGEIVIDKGGMLVCDEWFFSGIRRIVVSPAASAASLRAEISVDGGGHWQALPIAKDGVYMVDNHRPSLFRLINQAEAETKLTKIDLMQSDAATRTAFAKIEDAMLIGADKDVLPLLNEKFEAVRHTRGANLTGWQNIVMMGERPFYGWDQKDKASGKIEERCAQISFLKYQVEDDRPHEAWLISPTLSFKNAASKALTFRLRYELPSPDGQEKFGAYIITEKAGKAEAQYLDITKLLLVKDVDTETWYDYYVDLSKVEGISIDDHFHIAFSLYSPVGGKKTSLTFMLDDITFGRTDITRVSTDKEMLSFNFYPEVKAEPQALNVSVQNPDMPIAVTIVPGRLAENFIASTSSLPAKGGALAVGFYTKGKKDLAAALLLQARGGESKLVKLLAQNVTGVKVPNAEGDLKVYPTLTTDLLRIDGMYSRYFLFSADGRLISGGSYTDRLDVSALTSGRYLLQFVSEDGEVFTRTFEHR